MKRVIAFDMDDTLFPESQFVESGFKAVSSYVEKTLFIKDFFELAWEKYLRGERGKIFNQVLQDLDVDDDVNTISQLLDIYRSHKPDIHLFDDAIWALEYYSNKVDLALISDGYYETQKNKAASLNISKYFIKMYFTDKWGRKHWKPSCYVFNMLQHDFSVSGDNCIYISDNPNKDFIAPNKLGWLSVFIKRNTGEYSGAQIPSNGIPNFTIESLYALEGVLEI